MDPAPLYHDVSGAPDDGVAHWLHADDGVRIRVGHWTHDGAKGTILFFAGRNECVEKYGPTAAAMRARNFASVAIDWRGQGLADRLIPDKRLGHVDAFADYQRDVAAIMAHVGALDLPKPYFLVGHSMGGAIGLEALNQGLQVNAAAFSAPMWGIYTTPLWRAFAWIYTWIVERVGDPNALATGRSPDPYILETTLEENGLTSDREMFEWTKEQTVRYPALAIGGPSLHWVGLAFRETRRLSKQPSPDYPCIAFLGSDETTVDPARIRDRMARWPGGKLIDLQGARHELMIEAPMHRNRIFDELAAHFSAHGAG